MTDETTDNSADTIDISIFTPAELREPAKEEPKEPAATEEDAPEVEDDGDESEPLQMEPDQPKKRTTSGRIRKLAAERNRFQQEVMLKLEETNQLRAELAALKAGKTEPLTTEKQPANAGSVEAPDPENFRYGELDPQYIQAVARHEATQLVRAEMDKMRQTAEQAKQSQEAEQEIATLRAQADEVEKTGTGLFEDFAEVVVEGAKAGSFELTKEMFETAMDTGAAAEILYHLASNPEESSKVAAMTARQQALWFGRMETSLKKPTTPARKVTQAPDPMTPTKGAGGQGRTTADTTDFAAFEKMANAALKKG